MQLSISITHFLILLAASPSFSTLMFLPRFSESKVISKSCATSSELALPEDALPEDILSAILVVLLTDSVVFELLM